MLKKLLFTDCSHCAKNATILPRLILAAIFIGYGGQKLFGLFGGPGLEGVTQFFGSLGIPAPGLMAVFVAIVEFGGGILILLGLFTRITSLLHMGVMVVAIVTVHLSNGFFVSNGGFAWPLAVFGLSSVLVVMGGGALSLDTMIFGSVPCPMCEGKEETVQ